MVIETFNFTTGPSQLPDIGTLSYNGCVFSALFVTQVSGTPIKDESQRTIKYMEYTIKVDGYVTTPDNDSSIKRRMVDLRKMLSEQGGALVYKGRGCDIIVNNGSDLDVAWGPHPEVLEFQPLGAAMSAKVVWQCKVRINEQKRFLASQSKGKIIESKVVGGKKVTTVRFFSRAMLQFNYDSSVSYGEDGYSKLDVKGVIEIPLTRTPNQKTRTLQQTADDLRDEIDTRIMKGIDLAKFRVTSRNFSLSRDKRTLEWQISVEELPYQNMPENCTVANGSFNVRPTKSGPGLIQWLCTLRATYTVRADKPRRTALLAFYALMRHRMQFGRPSNKDNPFAGVPILEPFGRSGGPKSVLLWDFNVDEGLYLDSKTITLSATWRLISLFKEIMTNSGVWMKLPEKNGKGESLWAISMKDVQGSSSWLTNRADPKSDIIVDFGEQ